MEDGLRIGGLAWALVACVSPEPPAGTPPSQATPAFIVSITLALEEEEGGGQALEVFPSGYVRVTGRASGRGYVPELADGWYELTDTASLASLFHRAKANLEAWPSGITEAMLEAANGGGWPGKTGSWIEVTIRTSTGHVVFDEWGEGKERAGFEGYARLGMPSKGLVKLGTAEPPARAHRVDPSL